MAIKQRSKVESGFAMSSRRTLFFCCCCFLISSTMTMPNDIKINLQQSGAKTATEQVIARVFIDKEGNYYLASGKETAAGASGDA